MPIPEILQGRLRLPVIGAPMFIVSVPALVIALYVAPGTSDRTLYDHTSAFKSVDKLL